MRLKSDAIGIAADRNNMPLLSFLYIYIVHHLSLIQTSEETHSGKPTHTYSQQNPALSFLLQKNAKGQELFDQIVYHLDLVETDYFGLQFTDASQITVSITSIDFYVLQ